MSATLSIGGELAGRLTQLWAPMFAVAADEYDLQTQREAYEKFHAQFTPPPEVAIAPVNASGVPSFQLTAKAGAPPTVLYLHGGGHVMGSAFGYKPLIGALAAATDACVLAPEFRLAPEHPFPADLEDAARAYSWMVESGTPAERIVVAGDSSGAGLAMSLLLHLKREGEPLPGGALLFCPWVDLTGATLATRFAREEVAVLREQSERFVGAYLAGRPVDDPVISPLTADLSGLPPMLVQAATGDPQREEAHRLTERARAHGVDARLELYPVDTHGFQLFWSFLPEAMEGLAQAGAFVRAVARSHSSNVGPASVAPGPGSAPPVS